MLIIIPRMAERQQLAKSVIKAESNTPGKMKAILEKFKLQAGQSTRAQVDEKDIRIVNFNFNII